MYYITYDKFESLVSFEGWKPLLLLDTPSPWFESLVSFEGWKPEYRQEQAVYRLRVL